MDDLHSQTVKGLSWTGMGRFVRQIIMFALTIVLAHLLQPQDFGLIGMITVFTGFAALFGDMGFGAAIVQKKDLEKTHLNSVFWLNIVMGTALCVLFICIAKPLALFYNDPRLEILTKVFSCIFIFESAKIVQISLLEKEMNFKRLSWVEITADSVAGGIAVIMAFRGFGVWSLLTQSICTSVTTLILLWLSSNWRPSFSININSLKELRKFGLNLFGFNILNYFNRNADNLLIGKYLGSSSLGIYSWASRLMLFPIYQMSGVITRVMFPVLSSIQNDVERVKQIYLRAMRLIALIMFPIMIGLFVLAEPFISTILGNKWLEVIPVFKILCIVGIGQSIESTVGWIYTSQGRTDLMLKWGIFSGIINILSFIIGLRWGIIGVATAYALSGYLLLWYPSWRISCRLINLGFGEVHRNIASTFFAAAAMGLLLWFLQSVFPQGMAPWQRLTISVFCGGGIYWGLNIILKIQAYSDLLVFIRTWGPKSNLNRKI